MGDAVLFEQVTSLPGLAISEVLEMHYYQSQNPLLYSGLSYMYTSKKIAAISRKFLRI